MGKERATIMNERMQQVARWALTGSFVLLGGFVLAAALPAAANGIAGVDPAQRPVDAPVVSEVQHGDAWRERALRGISEPYPASLGFIEDQGNWYTPFDHPNATGVYDIRDLYPASDRDPG